MSKLLYCIENRSERESGTTTRCYSFTYHASQLVASVYFQPFYKPFPKRPRLIIVPRDPRVTLVYYYFKEELA